MIVFVGSNPSKAAQTFGAFTPDTKSGVILREWIAAAEIVRWIPINIANIVTPGNRPLNKSEIIISIPRVKSRLGECTKIVALGKTAHKTLDMAGIAHLEMPHPSGLNRKLNDPAYVKECIEKLREYAK